MSDDNEHMWQQVQDAVADERERCALLCTARAEISRVSAARLRSTKWFAGSRRRAAADLEAVAHAFDVVAMCIRRGFDVRK